MYFGRIVAWLWLAGAATTLVAAPCTPELKQLGPARPLPIEAPQGVAIDSSSDTLWISSALSNTLIELDRDLDLVGSVEVPLSQPGITGIAYNPDEDTLLVVQPRLMEIWEVTKDGNPTGVVVPLVLEAPVNAAAAPYPRGLAFDPRGDDGRGSIWVVESVMTRVYEVAWNGAILRSFCHPDDPDGCPGEGRAAFARDIDLVRSADGPPALDLIGGSVGDETIRRVTVDRVPTGLEIPLREIGGRPGGFARDIIRDPSSGNEKNVLYVTVESSAEILALESIEPRVLPPSQLTCEAMGDHIELGWRLNGAYDRLIIRQDGEFLAQLPSDSTRFVDERPRDGVLEYTVEARSGDCTLSESCTVVYGAGQVLDRVVFEGGNPQDITEDGEGRLWITTEENRLVVYTKDLELVATLAGPFDAPTAHTTGIAYDPEEDTLFVYNTSTHLRAEVDTTGRLVRAPVPSGIPADDPRLVASMVFDPAGDGGSGSFWYVDATWVRIEEWSRRGIRLRSCPGPEVARAATADGVEAAAYLWGLSTVPGQGFRQLETSSGGRRDLRATRLVRIDTETCEATGFEIPFAGMDAIRRPVAVAYLRTTVGNRETAFALNVFSRKPHLFRLETRAPSVPPVNAFIARQPGVRRDVLLELNAPEDAGWIEVRRDGGFLAALAGEGGAAGAAGVRQRYLDMNVPAGFHTYEAIVRSGALRSAARSCSLQVGPGSIARRELADPISLPHQIAVDPVAASYVVASRSRRDSEQLHFYHADLTYARSVPGPFRLPESIAALAVRSAGAESEIYCLGWRAGAAPGSQSVLPMKVTNPRGEVIRELEVTPPPAAPRVAYPSGMVWDSVTDTLWYLERNARTIVHIALDGSPLGSFAHPAPPYQDNVANLGLAIDARRGAIYVSGAGRLDQSITKILEITRGGRLTGVEIPVGSRFYDDVGGFTLSPDGLNIVAASHLPGVTDWVSYRAFDPLTSVTDLTCAVRDRDGVRPSVSLEWIDPIEYDRVRIFRDGTEVTSLPGSTESWIDRAVGRAEAPESSTVYRVVGERDGFEAAGALCTAWTRGPPPATFLRGDVDGNGTINITDALAILTFLFGGSAAASCHDAADVDDDGRLTISDAVSLLGFLFQGSPHGRAPAVPYPIPGVDPTMDELDCR